MLSGTETCPTALLPRRSPRRGHFFSSASRSDPAPQHLAPRLREGALLPLAVLVLLIQCCRRRPWLERERVADLLGSMLLAAVVAILMTLATAAATTALGWQVSPEVFAYILLVSIAGSWFVLVPSKFWEGTRGDSLLRRLVMMAMGVALGAFAWGAMQWLAVDPYDLDRFPTDHYELFRHARGAGQWPLSICLVAFGTLLLIVRWWLQADPLRRLRVSLWPTAYSMIAATLVAMVWHAHGWALVTVAGIMSISIQVAGPWLKPSPRQPRIKA